MSATLPALDDREPKDAAETEMSPNGAAPRARAPRSAWILSPLADLALLIAAPLAIVPTVLYLLHRHVSSDQIALVVVAFASLGHHLPGYMRAYGERELFERFRYRFLLAPPLILVVALFCTLLKLQALAVVLLFWATWHGLMQTYGLMRIYDLKRGVTDRLTARLDMLLCLAMFSWGIVGSDARMYGMMEILWRAGVPPLSAEWLHVARWGMGLTLAAVTIAFLVVNVARPKSGSVNWRKLLRRWGSGYYW